MTMVAIMQVASVDEPFELFLDGVRFGRALRQHGVDEGHVRALAELCGSWPPILVWGPDNVVVDGAHRVGAARRLGMRTISAIRFVGTSDEAFVEAVRRNVTHGLPLTISDRMAATRELLDRHPEWSDRWISGVCALSAKTVARLRRERCAEGAPEAGDPQLQVRLGRDGRTRPVAPGVVRGRIVQALAVHPDRSLRAIAAEVGASPETVRSVRNSLSRDVAPRGMAEPSESEVTEPVAAFRLRSVPSAVRVAWVDDRVLTSTAPGKDFAAWFEASSIADEWRQYLDAVPLSRIYEVADEARRRAGAWSTFAQTLEGRVKGRRSMRA
jgi:hypothetical protein